MYKAFLPAARIVARLSVVILLIAGLGSSPAPMLSRSPVGIDDDPAYPLPRWQHPAYGLNLYDMLYTGVSGDLDKVTELQFSWVKLTEHLPNLTNECPQRHHKLALRIPLPSPREPDTWDSWGQDWGATAAAFKDCIDAYEIGNEPNLAWEWDPVDPETMDPLDPDPGGYVQLLRIAYTNIKSADPDAIVISAGMATTGPVPPDVEDVWDDLRYLRAMYEAGAKPYFDALGSHPFGFKYPPETDPESIYYDPDEPDYPNNPDPVEGLCFRRVEQQRAVMEEYGDSKKQVWATEMGYIREPPAYCHGLYDWRYRLWHVVDPHTHGWYLARAFEYAAEHWPWLGPMFVFNFDFSRDPGTFGCDPKAWQAVVDSGGTAYPAFIHLYWLAKRPYALSDPTAISVTLSITDVAPVTVPFTLESIGVSPASWLLEAGDPWLTVAPDTTTIEETGRLTVTVDLAADVLPPGVYTTVMTLTGQENFFSNPERMNYDAFPRVIPVQVEMPERYTALIEPPSVFSMTPITDAAPFVVPLMLQNAGLSPATWIAETGDVWVTIDPISRTVTDTGLFTLSVNLIEDLFPGGLVGFHSTAISLTAQEGSLPSVVPIQVWVYDRLCQVYLPAVLKDR